MPSVEELQAMAEKGCSTVMAAVYASQPKAPQLPSPPQVDDDLLNAYQDAGLTDHARMQHHKIRCWQARQFGFPAVCLSEMATLLSAKYDGDLMVQELSVESLEYFLDTYNSKEYQPGGKGGGKRMITMTYRRMKEHRKLLFRVFPVNSTAVTWEAVHRPIDALAVPIPYGLMLRIQEIKKAKLFSHFSIFAESIMFSSAKATGRAYLIGSIIRQITKSERHDQIHDTFLVSSWNVHQAEEK